MTGEGTVTLRARKSRRREGGLNGTPSTFKIEKEKKAVPS